MRVQELKNVLNVYFIPHIMLKIFKLKILNN